MDTMTQPLDDRVAEWQAEVARRLQGITADLESLLDTFTNPLPDLVRFEDLQAGDSVKLAGEWQQVLLCSFDTDFEGHHAQRILVAEDGKPSWWYEVAPGEMLTRCNEPF